MEPMFLRAAMVEKDNKESIIIRYDDAFYIWWEQIWRIAFLCVVLYAIRSVSLVIFPVIYGGVSKLASEHLATTWFMLAIVFFYAYLRITREALTDSYSRFFLIAEDKKTGKSLFGLDNRLVLSLLLPLCWAQYWRILMAPLVMYCGLAAMAFFTHADIEYTVYMMIHHGPFYIYCALMAVPFSFWATYESLASSYGSFRLTVRHKTFYEDNSPI